MFTDLQGCAQRTPASARFAGVQFVVRSCQKKISFLQVLGEDTSHNKANAKLLYVCLDDRISGLESIPVVSISDRCDVRNGRLRV